MTMPHSPDAAPTARAKAAAPRATTWPVPIGVAAQRAGISARMVRHYESLGLISGVARTDSGYRQYTEADVHALHFIRRSRDLGFSMEEIAELLGLCVGVETVGEGACRKLVRRGERRFEGVDGCRKAGKPGELAVPLFVAFKKGRKIPGVAGCDFGSGGYGCLFHAEKIQ